MRIVVQFEARFASVIVNLGPTFLSGALAANAGKPIKTFHITHVVTIPIQAHSWMSPVVLWFRWFLDIDHHP